jgi:hypothetical protein
MSRLLPDEKCSRCGSLLFPPELAAGLKIPLTADFVCVNCGCLYKWEGAPPALNALAAVATEAVEDDDSAW